MENPGNKQVSATSSAGAGCPGTSSLLLSVDSPADLRRLEVSQLPALCGDIRDFLIHSLSDNPGHFASSMGAVDLTVALHYVFNTPYDRIVWDVGHQAYAHKLLTGRRDKFHTNRKFGGLSGFPSPKESDYDTFMAGHASNSISAALGMAVSAELKHDNPRRNVIAVIGDASISGGLAFEGLNNAANTPNNLLIILNDNDMSIDPNVGSLHSYLAQITTSRGYNNFRYKLYKLLRKMNLISDRRKGALMRFSNSLKALLSREQNIFEGLNIRYFGPVDGNDVQGLVKILTDIKDMKGPRLLHIKTRKGKGYQPAEQDPATWHAPGKFNPATGEIIKGAAGPHPPKYQEVFGETLLELARQDSRIIGITAAMPSGTSMNILSNAMPDRVFDVGISEGHAVTFAGGLAKEGLRPFVAIYSSFLQRAFDNIIHDVALMDLPVTFCIDRAGIVGEDGVTHHGTFDLGYMSQIPGMIVASPRNEMQLRDLLYTASLRESSPMAIRYPRGSGSNVDWRSPMKRLEIGKGEKLREGADLAVISTGPIATEVAKALDLAAGEGISAAHYNMIFVKPLDEAMLEEIAKSGQDIVTVEDASVSGGLGAAVAHWLDRHGYRNNVRRVGIPDRFVAQGTVAELYHLCGMDAGGILSAIKETVSSNKQ